MIIEQWTQLFQRQWESCIRQPLTLDTVNQILQESSRIQGTGIMQRRNEQSFKLLSIYVHFGLGVIFRVDEMESMAVALIHKHGRHRSRDWGKSETEKTPA